jgi:hypothetical protein
VSHGYTFKGSISWEPPMDLLLQMCDTARSCASRTQNWRNSHHEASKYVVLWHTSGWRDDLSTADLRRLFNPTGPCPFQLHVAWTLSITEPTKRTLHAGIAACAQLRVCSRLVRVSNDDNQFVTWECHSNGFDLTAAMPRPECCGIHEAEHSAPNGSQND